MAKKFYVTTAIAYPNAAPHLGHALEIIQADVIARFNRLLGKDVFFQTGTDEHGIKNYQTAQKQGKDIKDFLDKNVALFKKLFNELNISYDQFIRTTDKKKHHPGAIKLWKELVKSGDIYKKKYKGLYCSGCEAFKTEKELNDGKCPNHPTKDIEFVEEENYFFKLSRYKDTLAKLINDDTYRIIPQSRKNEIISFLKDAKDISFSRPKTTLPWGIPVPDDDEQIMYVWCDALSNYITGVGYGRDDKNFRKQWPADIHIVGKDILRFHAAFWPAMLLSAKVDLPKQLFVHGFILSKGQKMSKSTGNIIEPFDQIKKFGVDKFRFYMLEAMPYDGDGDYTEELALERINTELVGNVSNFCYRVLSFTNKNFSSKIEHIADDPVLDEIKSKVKDIRYSYENVNFKKALDEILAVAHLGNKYFQDNEPWKLIKEDKEHVHAIMGTCVTIVKDLSILLSPVIPEFAEELQKQLNMKGLMWKDIGKKVTKHKIGKAKILVKKVEEVIEMTKETFPLDLRVAKVIDVKDHPDADKLMIIDIDLGTEKRQIVAGLKEYYTKEEFIGKNLVVVCNLKKAKLRGVESQAMLLAADAKEKVGVLTVKESKPGDKVSFEGLENNTEEITFDDFMKIKMKAKDCKAYYNDTVMHTDTEEVTVERITGEAKIR